MLPLTILLTLWPYLFFVGCFVLFSLNGNGGVPLVIFLVMYTILSVVLDSLYRSYAKSLTISPQQLAKHNLIVKLIPAVCDLFLYASITVSYIQTRIDIANGAMMCVPIYLIIFVLLIPYNVSRLCMLFATMHVTKHALNTAHLCKNQPIPDSTLLLHTILHMLPIAHVVSAIWVYRKLKQLPFTDTNT